MKTSSREWPAASLRVHPLSFLLLILCGFGCGRSDLTTDRPAEPTRATAAPLTPLTNMVPIKAATFQSGKRSITVSRDFWIGRYEVTQAEYQSLMGKNPSHFQGEPSRPVEKVSWVEASAYCEALSQRERKAGRLPAGYVYRLPSEAEWELACRAGTTNVYSFGDDATTADQYAWTLENSESTTHSVGQKRPNSWGLYDMHGNVWEWCQDWFDDVPRGDATNLPKAPPHKYKVFRGGGWNQTLEFARPQNRFMMSPANGIYFVGFRVALGNALIQSQDR